ncbi:hypothetical protein DPMN_042787 [Dreissena polymorpha]|uniref:Uncharacterized protein n=1 Tax=Dreissena polymorpha TaxID=45954 RepID=A0A9D4HX79_DREPO|nr:hypothetical protein DPMN_042787 [Dreissena polymorpha]
MEQYPCGRCLQETIYTDIHAEDVCKKRFIQSQIYRLLGYLHKGDISCKIYRASLRLSRKRSSIAMTVKKKIKYRFVCLVSTLMKEGRDHRWHYPDSVPNPDPFDQTS